MLAGQWQNFRVESLGADEAQSLGADWQSLSENTLQPAGYNAPELILPLLRNLGGASLATVRHGPDLHLAMPILNKRMFLKSWETPLTASGLPHLAEGLAENALLSFINAQSKPILFKAIPTEGKFFETLKRQSARFHILEQWQRAGLRLAGSFEDWLQSNFDQKRRKEFKRLRNRLSEQGTLLSETLKTTGDPISFVDDFLALEAAGWKGQKGTAIAAQSNLSKALHEAIQALHKSGKLRFWRLSLNGKAVASLFAIVEGDQAWLGKIAYDESFAKYSPGVQIILDCTESFFAEKQIKQIDSSAIPGHPMIDRIWRDRIGMATVFVAPATVSNLRFNATVKLEQQRLYWRSLARDTYYKIRGVKRS